MHSAVAEKQEKTIENSASYQDLIKKILAKNISVGVIGLGYVGLPFLLEKAKVGLHVVGIDRSQERVDLVAQGDSYISDVNSNDLQKVVSAGFVKTTTNYEIVADLDVLVICVPTPLDKNHCPDLQFVTSVAENIAKYIRPGQLISLESTTYPGTTEDVILPILEKSGLKGGKDFFLVHSPERVDPGNKRYTTKNTNKVVGGIDNASLEVAKAFYGLAIENLVPVSSAKAAEMVKVYENTYRAVNIALANEVALLSDRMGINVWEVLDAAFTKPFGIMPFYPGPGVGGHCIPIDPHYLEWKAKEYQFQTRFIALASETNVKIQRYVYDKTIRLLNRSKKALNGAKVLMLGVAYKADLADARESPALSIFAKFAAEGADIIYHDAFIPEITIEKQAYRSQQLTDELLQSADIVLIITNHSTVDYQRVVNKAQLVFDTRNATRGINADNVVLL